MVRRLTRWAVLGVLWAVNPGYLGGCNLGGEFGFGQADMVELLDALNEEEWTFENEDGAFELALSLQAGSGEVASVHGWSPVNTAYACGTRSFVASAGACLDTTTLALDGTVTITDSTTGASVALDLVLEGMMEVIGLELSNARVTLNHEDGQIRLSSDDGRAFQLDEAGW